MLSLTLLHLLVILTLHFSFLCKTSQNPGLSPGAFWRSLELTGLQDECLEAGEVRVAACIGGPGGWDAPGEVVVGERKVAQALCNNFV
jgi:hypothetical protein